MSEELKKLPSMRTCHASVLLASACIHAYGRKRHLQVAVLDLPVGNVDA